MSKGNTIFSLKEPYSQKETSVLLIYRNIFKFKYSIQEKINPEDWNPATMRMREKRGLPYINFNHRLNFIERSFADIVLLLKNENRLTKEDLKKELDFALNIRKKETLLDYMQTYVDDRTAEGDYNLCKNVQTTKLMLERFSAEKSIKVTYQDITPQFFEKFVLWMEKQGYSRNYIGKMIANLKRMMNRSLRENLKGKLRIKCAANHSKFIVFRTAAETVNFIGSMNFSNNPRFENIDINKS